MGNTETQDKDDEIIISHDMDINDRVKLYTYRIDECADLFTAIANINNSDDLKSFAETSDAVADTTVLSDEYVKNHVIRFIIKLKREYILNYILREDLNTSPETPIDSIGGITDDKYAAATAALQTTDYPRVLENNYLNIKN